MSYLKLPSTLKDWLLPRATAIEEPTLVAPGLYDFRRESRGIPLRFHLRVDEDGPAILIAGACEALLLSPEGAAAAKGLLEGRTPAEVEQSLPVPHRAQVVEDVRHAIEDLGHQDLRYPIFNLVDPALYERPWRMSAPFQADLVVAGESLTSRIIDKLWEARIPHVRLITTPRTDKSSLVKAVMHAEDLGMISGVRTRQATWLDESTLGHLAGAGVDYVVLPWGVEESLHDHWYGKGDFQRFRQLTRLTLANEVTPVAHAALMQSTWDLFPGRLDELIELGIAHIEVFAIAEQSLRPDADRRTCGFDASALRQLAGWIEDLADKRRVQIVWLPPVLHARHRSLEEIVRMSPRAGGDVTIRVEANGDVVPPRGPWLVAGNILEDEWSSIWGHSAFHALREKVELPTRCAECRDMTVCAAFCPADAEGWVL